MNKEDIKNLLNQNNNEAEVQQRIISIAQTLFIAKVVSKTLNKEEIKQILKMVDPIVEVLDKVTTEYDLIKMYEKIKKDFIASVENLKK